MHFLYIAPRYHTNQIPIMKGLKQKGHQVTFLSQYVGKLEDYSVVKPIVIGYTPIYLFFDAIYMRVMKGKNSYAGDKKIKYGVPRLCKLVKYIKISNADVAILRERSVYSVFAYLICKHYKIPTILYNQSPLWEKEIKNDLPHRMIRLLTPKVRMTPVLGVPGEDKEKEKGAKFVPFVMEPVNEMKDMSLLPNEMVKIFCIGKYEKRKNHKMLVEVLKTLPVKDNVHLSIAGECTSEVHQKYYKELEELIQQNQLEKNVTLYKNLNREAINNLYMTAHMFIIPSTEEPASISQLEAMAHALPVICSDKNGTACYVQDGVNGYLFEDNNSLSLRDAMRKMLENINVMEDMGRASLCIIKEKCQIETYIDGVIELLEQIGVNI